MLMFAETDEICKHAPKVPISRLLASDWSVTAGAFVVTNPIGELITSGLPIIQGQQSVSASCSFFYLLAVDRPTLGWRRAQDKGIGPMVSDGIQPSAAPEDRPYAQRFRPLPSCGAAAPAFSE